MIHTKGNWNYKKVGIRFFIGLENYPNEVRTDTNAGYICEIGKGMERTALTEQDEANAKLICAAPEMLEVLTSTFRRLWELRDSETICEQDREIIIDIETTVLDVMVKAGYDYKNANAATGEAESNMHQIFQDALKPFGIK